MTEEQAGITPESTLNEVFDFLAGAAEPGAAVQVVPMTVQEQEKDTRLAVFVKGEQMTASMIFAAMMETLENLHERQEQDEAEDEQLIVGP